MTWDFINLSVYNIFCEYLSTTKDFLISSGDFNQCIRYDDITIFVGPWDTHWCMYIKAMEHSYDHVIHYVLNIPQGRKWRVGRIEGAAGQGGQLPNPVLGIQLRPCSI